MSVLAVHDVLHSPWKRIDQELWRRWRELTDENQLNGMIDMVLCVMGRDKQELCQAEKDYDLVNLMTRLS